MIKERYRHILTRRELNKVKARDFKEGDLVICNKYYIHIKYGSYKNPSFETNINTRKSFLDIPIWKLPYYIQDFIER